MKWVYVESFPCWDLQTNHFSIQLDESTLLGNEELLLAYFRFVNDEEIHEELRFARNLTTDTKGDSTFNVLKDYAKIYFLSNIIAAAMFGWKKVLEVFAIHWVIPRQHLVAKNLSAKLHKSLPFIINTINRICSKALNSRLFLQLCQESNEDVKRFLLHIELRWLSKMLCLKLFQKGNKSCQSFWRLKIPFWEKI